MNRILSIGGKIPSWALEIIEEAIQDYDLGWVEVNWRNSHQHPWSSSGRAWGRHKINILASKKPTEQKVVLLHELAHLIVSPNNKHDDQFWDTMLILCRKYGVVKAALSRETNSLRRARRRALAAGRI